MLWVLEHSSGPMQIVSDCLGVVNGAQKVLTGAQVTYRAHRADLWLMLKAAGEGRQVQVRWVPSHEDRGSTRLTEEDRWGNAQADALAQWGVEQHVDQEGRDQRVWHLDSVAKGVAKTHSSPRWATGRTSKCSPVPEQP